MLPNADVPLTLEAAEKLSPHVVGTMASEIGFPLKTSHLMVESGGLMLQAQPGDSGGAEKARYLGNANLAYIEGVQDHLEITGDRWTAQPRQMRRTSGCPAISPPPPA